MTNSDKTNWEEGLAEVWQRVQEFPTTVNAYGYVKDFIAQEIQKAKADARAEIIAELKKSQIGLELLLKQYNDE
jgi:hypothetical protein